MLRLKRTKLVVLCAAVTLAPACGGERQSTKVFDELQFPEGAEVVAKYGGDEAATYRVSVPATLTESTIGFPPAFDDSTPHLFVTRGTQCDDEVLAKGPRPSAECRASRVAERRGPDPSDPEKRYCSVSVQQWTNTYNNDDRAGFLAQIAMLCNQPNAQLGG